MSRYYYEEAIILSGKKVGESNLLLSIYGKTKGKYQVIAPGALKLRNRLRGRVDPFTFGKGYFVIRRNYDWLINWEVYDYYLEIKRDLEKYFSASKLVNILNEVIPFQAPDKDVFMMLLKTLNNLKYKNIRNVDDIFLLKLLQQQGYVTSISYICGKCGKNLENNESIFIDVNENKAYCKDCRNIGISISFEELRLINSIIDSDIELTLNLDLSDSVREIIKRYKEKAI